MTEFRLSRLAENVKRRREAVGISQRELARRAGLSQPTVLAIEQGSSPSVDSVVRIARALNVSLTALVDDGPRDIESLIPGWGTLSADEQHHFRSIITLIAESRGWRAGLRAAEDRADYATDAAAIAEAQAESVRLSDGGDAGSEQDGGEERRRPRRAR